MREFVGQVVNLRAVGNRAVNPEDAPAACRRWPINNRPQVDNLPHI
jgi:hypothetical protein